MTPSIFQILVQAKKARSLLDRGKKSNAKKGQPSKHGAFASSSTSVADKFNPVPTSSPWDLLPVEIQIKIFAHCGVKDLLPLRLVCRSFQQLLKYHEPSISREYLRQRRHGTLPSPIDSERSYTRNPEDDVVLLSDLFPPAKSAKGGHLYTFRYVHSLRRRQKLCSRLCYYIAGRIMDRFTNSEPVFMKNMFPSKNERQALVQRGVASLWFNLIPHMYYALYFLETYSLARREQTNTLLHDFEAGRISLPISPEARNSMYRELQLRILQSPPFTDTSTLISTHHCMDLLVSYLRNTVPPGEPGELDDSFIGSLLTVSPFVRVVEFFSAEIGDGGGRRMQRKDFMYNFQNDITLNEKDDMNTLVFGSGSTRNMHSSIRDIWFDVAMLELFQRKAFPHDPEKILVWNDIPVIFGCSECRQHIGWPA
ncbi:hypothetical protein ASPWEDRAFT_38130 [Aspergillus wentii DTO 134E9]|uniref:F-box domain-containing protein n=1 Tax=Aspergillus wentii DTO 134E9 TaxID=1073089 RepID=A0A1L9RNP2_ASPWE|nr:uncharacterized protein ASPWEDRAFT_38130 [Aspergillus wentii DTO 134E9]OJJ36534.1 hypothetical protein ASPWEDRAFT_38130 [Aspergillus wentii DTO 134E9]